MKSRLLYASAVCLVLSACSDTALVFASRQTFGVNISASTSNQPVSLVLGYEGNDGTVIPTAVAEDSKLVTSESVYCPAMDTEALKKCLDARNKDPGGVNALASSNGALLQTDALSVFSTFNGDGSTRGEANGAAVGASLGKVFATGIAAQKMSAGTANALQAKAVAACVASLSGIATEAERIRLIGEKC
ncbi:MAG: hypothetical protein IT566_17130 [Rhodospirillaceae bacterium]|nr:hypothetical protein [Rhodospirillaceae bacterium]